MKTVLQVLHDIEELFSQNYIENGKAEALWLVEKVYGVDKISLLVNTRYSSAEQEEYVLQLAKRRINGEPIQYVLQQWEFMGNVVSVGRGVLIPRDDTQVVVSGAFDYIDGLLQKTQKSVETANVNKQGNNEGNAADSIKNCGELKILDLCSGSGIIAVSLAKKYKNAYVCALEKSDDAFEYLKENIRKNNVNVKCVLGDVFKDYNKFDNGFFDLIISNPPYIKTADIPFLQKEVQFEPVMALDGGDDGYNFYRAITGLWSNKLKDGGMFAFELGEGQFDYVSNLMVKSGFENVRAYYDFSNIKRAVTAIYSG